MARSGVSLKVTGDKAIIANLYAKRRGAVARIRKTNRRFAAEVRDRARELAPVDEGNLRDSLTFEMSDQDRVFTVFHDPSHFPEAPYHVFQELGFRHWQSGEFIQRPHLFPAFEQKRGEYSAAIAADIRSILNR